MKGKIIVIDGMDGTGKETQSKLLFEKLKERIDKVIIFSFPNYESDSSFFVKKFLKEGYCRDIEDVPLLHDMFYSIDRGITYAKEIKEKYEDGYIIILDRYTISNAIYRLDKVKDHNGYLMDLAKIEHTDLKLPVPDINIILYSYPEVNIKLIEARCKENNVEKDLNETLEIQNKVYENIKTLYSNCVAKMALGPIQPILVNDSDGNMNSREFIYESIIKIIEEKYI